MREIILDIRTPEEVAQGFLPGAILIPTPLPPLDQLQKSKLKDNLRKSLEGVPRNVKVFVYCKKGKRAKIAEKFVKKMGYEVTNLGGVEGGWLADQLRQKKLRLYR